MTLANIGVLVLEQAPQIAADIVCLHRESLWPPSSLRVFSKINKWTICRLLQIIASELGLRV